MTKKLVFLAIFSVGLLPHTGVGARQATLSASTTSPAPGERFFLTIEAQGQSVGFPRTVDVPGIKVLSRRRSMSRRIIEGRSSRSTSFELLVVAEKEGRIEVPGIEVAVDGQKVKTNPLTLTVKKGKEKAFLRVVPARDEIFVGETVEVGIKAYLDAKDRVVNYSRKLSLEGENLILKPTVGPDVEQKKVGNRRSYHFKQERLDGRTLNVLTYKTTLTAVKPGEVVLAPVDFEARILMPRGKRPPLGLPGNAFDPFASPFDPFGVGRNHLELEVRCRSRPVKLRVLSLPSEGRPEHFAGAIGNFSLDVQADKENLKVDEALVVTATITGYGNFDRIGDLDCAPHSKWKAYPPKIEFTSADDLNFSGEKRFDYTFIAAAATAEAPGIRFCFFDPEARQYVSLAGDPISVRVTGSGGATLSNRELAALADQAANPAGNTLAAVPVSPSLSFFQGQRWLTLGSRSLLAINGTAAVVALGLVLCRWRRRDRPPTPRKRERSLRRQQARLLGELRSAEDPAVLDEKLTRWLALQRQLGRSPAPGGDEVGAARHVVDELPESTEQRQALEDFLSWSGAGRWSGGAASTRAGLAHRKQAWLQALEIFDRERPT